MRFFMLAIVAATRVYFSQPGQRKSARAGRWPPFLYAPLSIYYSYQFLCVLFLYCRADIFFTFIMHLPATLGDFESLFEP